MFDVSIETFDSCHSADFDDDCLAVLAGPHQTDQTTNLTYPFRRKTNKTKYDQKK